MATFMTAIYFATFLSQILINQDLPGEIHSRHYCGTLNFRNQVLINQDPLGTILPGECGVDDVLPFPLDQVWIVQESLPEIFIQDHGLQPLTRIRNLHRLILPRRAGMHMVFQPFLCSEYRLTPL